MKSDNDCSLSFDDAAAFNVIEFITRIRNAMLSTMKKWLLGMMVALMVVAAGCGGGGGDDKSGGSTGSGGGSTPEPSGPSAPTPSASFSDGVSTFTAGRIVSLDVENFALTEQLVVTVGGSAVPAHVVSGRLIFVMPVDLSGPQTISVKNNTSTLTVPVTVEALTSPANPAAYVAEVHSKLDSLLDELIADAVGEDLSLLLWAKEQLEDQQDVLDQVDADTLKQLAAVLKANDIDELFAAQPMAGTFSFAQKADLARCNALSDAYPKVFMKAILSTGLVVAGLFPPSPLLAVGIAAMVITVKQAHGVVGDIVDACLNPFGEPLLQEVSGGTSVGGGVASLQKIQIVLPFNHNSARTFKVEVPARLLDVVGDGLTTLAHRLGGLIRFARESSTTLADHVPAAMQNELLNFQTEKVIPGEANAYTLGSISDARITGTVNSSGSNLIVKFAYLDGQIPQSAVNFEFTLIDVTANELAGTYGATLNALGLPTASGGSIDVRYGETYTGRLSGTFADRYVIVTQPLRGTVTLVNAETGEFTYHTSSQEDLPDEFTYRAVNAAGDSANAKVQVSVDLAPVYEAAVLGTWKVTYTNTGPQPPYEYTMVLSQGGSGYYMVDTVSYPIRWEIERDSEGYKLYDYGFWHFAFDALPRTPLTLPVTQFSRLNHQREPVEGTFVKQ